MLEYEKISTIPQKYQHLCMVHGSVCDDDGEISVTIGDYSSGERCADRHSPSSRMHMDPGHDGIGLGGLIANTDSLLIVHSELKKLIAKRLTPRDEVEMLPLVIVNHKGRVASKDYFIINPVGTLDCLDYAKSKVKRTRSGEVISVSKYVLSRKKLEWEPAIFRPLEDEFEYFIRGDITTEFKESGFKDRNIFVETLEIV